MNIRFPHVAQHRQNEFVEKYAGSRPSWVATYLNDYVDTCFCEKVPASSDGSGGKNCRIMWQNAFEHFSPFNLSAAAVNMVIAELGTLRPSRMEYLHIWCYHWQKCETAGDLRPWLNEFYARKASPTHKQPQMKWFDRRVQVPTFSRRQRLAAAVFGDHSLCTAIMQLFMIQQLNKNQCH